MENQSHIFSGNLYVDGKGPLKGETKGHFQGLDLKDGLYIGGVPSFTNISSQNGFSTGFVGMYVCL